MANECRECGAPVDDDGFYSAARLQGDPALLRTWAAFHDEDGVWRIVTSDGDYDVTWPEMNEADCERAVNEHNAAVRAALAASPPEPELLDVERLARVLLDWAPGYFGTSMPATVNEGVPYYLNVRYEARKIAAAYDTARLSEPAQPETPE